MKSEQALQVLEQAAKQARLTYQEHATVDQATEVLQEVIKHKKK